MEAAIEPEDAEAMCNLDVAASRTQRLETLGLLAGGIAHDFNNLLSVIVGYGEMAQKRAAEGTALRRDIDAVLTASKRAKSLVGRILAFCRSGAEISRTRLPIQAVVTEAVDLVAVSLPRGVQLHCDLAARDATVMGDLAHIHQIIMNLCANAVDAMGPHGTLSVTLDRIELDKPRACSTGVLPPGSFARLRVRDTGTGIPPNVVGRIFDPFFTTKAVGHGTGLGLSLVRDIVAAFGGAIDVHSAGGDGSTFSVYLPAGDEPAQAVAPA